MRICDLIPPEAVILDISFKDKHQAIAAMAEELAAESHLDPATVAAALESREELGSTGVGHGIALPHVCMTEVDFPRLVFARLKPAIDFDAIDGKPVDLVCAILTPMGPHCNKYEPLSILAAVSRLLGDKANAKALRAARNVSAVRSIFSACDSPAVTLVS